MKERVPKFYLAGCDDNDECACDDESSVSRFCNVMWPWLGFLARCSLAAMDLACCWLQVLSCIGVCYWSNDDLLLHVLAGLDLASTAASSTMLLMLPFPFGNA